MIVTELEKQYPTFPFQEIDEAAKENFQRGAAMLLGNLAMEEARKKASGLESHEPKLHSSGWHMGIETPNGVVALWSCWLENELVLGYPINHPPIDDQVIMKILEVERAKRVVNVEAVAVGDWDYQGEYKDPGKPLELNKCGQIIAYRDRGKRQWADFYGPRYPDQDGRVWIKHDTHHMHGVYFDTINRESRDGIEKFGLWSHNGRFICTYPFNYCSRYSPDNPTTNGELIQTYRDKFLALLCEVVQIMGGPKAVHINYGFVFVPEQLSALDYQNIEWLKGTPGFRRGMGSEIVRAERGEEILILQSGNSLVPWSLIRYFSYSFELTPEKLLEFLTI